MQRTEIINLASSLAKSYCLPPPARQARGRAGVYTGSGSGSSIDFHDFREYQPGDDLRRIDWRAYARNGSMMLKLYREEVSPLVEIIVDLSSSMSLHPAKEQGAIFLLAFLAGTLRNTESRPVLVCGKKRFTGGAFEEELLRLNFDDNEDFSTHQPLINNSLRFVISDFLFEEKLDHCLQTHCAGSAATCNLMLLSKSEKSPELFGGYRLTNCENPSERSDLRINHSLIEAYRQRLDKHQAHIAETSFRCGGRLAELITPDKAFTTDSANEIINALLMQEVVAIA